MSYTIRNGTHSAQVPAVVARYFGPCGHPIITREFSDRWRSQSYKKRITVSWARKLKRQGVTQVTLTMDGRMADFSLDEIIRGGIA